MRTETLAIAISINGMRIQGIGNPTPTTQYIQLSLLVAQFDYSGNLILEHFYLHTKINIIHSTQISYSQSQTIPNKQNLYLPDPTEKEMHPVIFLNHVKLAHDLHVSYNVIFYIYPKNISRKAHFCHHRPYIPLQ